MWYADVLSNSYKFFASIKTKETATVLPNSIFVHLFDYKTSSCTNFTNYTLYCVYIIPCISPCVLCRDMYCVEMDVEMYVEMDEEI